MEQIGPYRIIRTVGVGGMGEVCLASLSRSGGFEKRVAIKRLLPALAGDPTFVALFEREARLAALLSHPHVVQIFDFGRTDDTVWLAMEYVHGVDLRVVLDDSEPLPLGLVAQIGVACALALDYAHHARTPDGHRLGMVHQDVSPHNVLLSFEGEVKLADFGLARPLGPGATESLRGKTGYLSPEVCLGAPPDARSDQFALGVVLQALLDGTRHHTRTEAPPALSAVVARCVAESPEARHPDLGALAEALRAAARADHVEVGTPNLGTWLKAHFTPQVVSALSMGDATATAAVPIVAPTAPTSTTPATTRSKRPLTLTLAALAALGGALWLTTRSDAPAPRRSDATLAHLATPPDAATLRAAIQLDAATPNAITPDAATPNAITPDAATPNAITPDAATLNAIPLDAIDAAVDAAVDAAPTTIKTRRDRPKLVRPRPRPRPPQPDAAHAVTRPVDAGAPDAEPRRVDATVTLGPAVRILSGAGHTRWRPVVKAGALLTSQGAQPTLTLRIWPRKNGFSMVAQAEPLGRLRVDGRDLGDTPVAGIPLQPGRREISVQSPDGRRTTMVLELDGG